MTKSNDSFSIGKMVEHVEGFVEKLNTMDGVRLPGVRRHNNRLDKGPRKVNATLLETIEALKV